MKWISEYELKNLKEAYFWVGAAAATLGVIAIELILVTVYTWILRT